jgi:ABC-type transport system substrate-binding protein
MGEPTTSRRRYRAPWLAGFAVVLSLLAAACGAGDDETSTADDDTADATTPADEAPEPHAGGKLVYGIDAESDGYNPVTNRWAQSGHTVASAVYDPLATIDEQGQAVPYLAESIEPNDDFTEWTVTLREGVVFHNGDPLTADAVAEVFEAHRGGLVTASYLQPVTDIEVVDDLTLVFTVDAPWVTFPYALASQIGYVMHPAMLTDPDSAAEPVGTGPFVFEAWDRGRSWSGARNDDYWRTDDDGTPLPYLDRIEFVVYEDGIVRNEALENGDVDLLFTLTPQAILDLRGNSTLTVAEYNRGDEDLIALNAEQAPFDNVHARRALAHATNQEEFLTEIQNDVFVTATGPFAPGQLGHRDDNGYPEFDLEKAQEEVALYQEDTGEPLSFVYTAADDVDNLAAAQSLAEMWSQAGVGVEIAAVPQSEIIFSAVTGQYEAIDWRNWSVPDPDGDYVWWHSSGFRPLEEGVSLNVSRFGDDEIDAALDEARGSTDQEERDEAYARVAARMGEMAPYVWLGRVGWAMAADDQAHGWETAVENGTVATVGPKTWISELWLG